MARGDGLGLAFDPFEEKGVYVGQPVQQALAKVFHHFEQGARCILVVGKAGTGKTLLLDLIERNCAENGRSTCRFDRGDIADALPAPVQIVLVDEAESLAPSTVQRFTDAHCGAHARTAILACVEPSAASLHSTVEPIIVTLAPLDGTQAKACLLEQSAAAGRPDLFTAGALDLIVESAGGLPRLLMSTAKLALFCARLGGASQVDQRHVTEALRVQMRTPAETPGSAAIPAPVEAIGGHLAGPSLAERVTTGRLLPRRRQHLSGRRLGTIAATANRMLDRVDASAGEGAALASAVFLGGFIIPWLLSAEPAPTGPVPVLPVDVAHDLPFAPPNGVSEASAIDPAFLGATIGSAAGVKTQPTFLANKGESDRPSTVGKAQAQRDAATTERPTRPRPPAVAAVQPKSARIEGRARSQRPVNKRELAALPVKPFSAPVASMPLTLVPIAPPESIVVSDDRQFLIDVTRASRATLAEAWTGSAPREPGSQDSAPSVEANSVTVSDGPGLASGSLRPAVVGTDSGGTSVAEPLVLRTGDVRPATLEATGDLDVTEATRPARAASEQIHAAVEAVQAAKTAKDAVEQLKAVRGTIDSVKAAKDAAEIAKAAKESIAIAKAAKESLDSVKAAKDAAEIAKAAKDAAKTIRDVALAARPG